MREKARLFRSLMVESLECRSVFSVDGLDVWQCIPDTSRLELDQIEPAQFQRSGQPMTGDDHHSHRAGSHRRNFDHEFDLPPEGEGIAFDVARGLNANLSPRFPTQLTPNQTSSTQSNDPHIVIAVNTLQTQAVFSQFNDVNLDNAADFQVDSGNRTASSSSGNSSIGRVAPSPQNSATATPTISTGNSETQAHLTTLSQLSLSDGTTKFDFSSRLVDNLGANHQRTAATSFSGPRAGNFNFTKPHAFTTDSLINSDLVERTAGVATVGNLLSQLAESQQHGRTQYDANLHFSKSEQAWRPEQNSVSEEVTFADGGMIALALNREMALIELEELSKDAHSEKKAWVANVGIYRAFENDAVAATEYTGMTTRVGRIGESRSTKVDLADGESEVASTQLRPLLASASAAIGVVMFGLRRFRKSVPLLMYTSRKR